MKISTQPNASCQQVDAIMAALVVPENTRFRTLRASGSIGMRTVLSGAEKTLDGRLFSDALNALVIDAGYEASDVIFAHPPEEMNESEESGIRLAVHNIARYLAMVAETRFRDGLYLATQLVLLESLAMVDVSDRVEAIRSWVRMKLGGNIDPDTIWLDDALLGAIRATSELDAWFLSGLMRLPTEQMSGQLELPCPLTTLLDVAQTLQALAVFEGMTVPFAVA